LGVLHLASLATKTAGSGASRFAMALELLKNRIIDVNFLITDKFPLKDINRAFEKALNGEGGKILVKP